jgi:hypothetical protein
MWLGIYTFTARMFGRAGRAMNAGGITKPFTLAAIQRINLHHDYCDYLMI